MVDDDVEYGLIVRGNSEETFTGYALIDAAVAGKVTRTNAKVRLAQ